MKKLADLAFAIALAVIVTVGRWLGMKEDHE